MSSFFKHFALRYQYELVMLVMITMMCIFQDCCLTSVYVQHKIPNVNAQHVIARNLDTGEYMRMGGRPT